MKDALRDLRLLVGWQPGSLRLMVARLVALVCCAAPTAIGVERSVPAGWGTVPRLAQRATDPTLDMILGAMRGLSGSTLGWALAGMVLWLVLDRMLSAAAIGTLGPPASLGRQIDRDVGLRHGLRRYGWRRLGTLLRLWGWTVLITAAGFVVLEMLLEPLSIVAERRGLSGLHRFLTLPLLRVGLSLGWVACMGAFSLWGRVAIVADSRRRAWRTAWIVLGIPRRAPVPFGATVALVLVTQGAGLAILGEFLPAQGGAVTWFVWLIWQTWVWHALSRMASHVYQSGCTNDLRPLSDAPFSFDSIARRAAPGSPGPTG